MTVNLDAELAGLPPQLVRSRLRNPARAKTGQPSVDARNCFAQRRESAHHVAASVRIQCVAPQQWARFHGALRSLHRVLPSAGLEVSQRPPDVPDRIHDLEIGHWSADSTNCSRVSSGVVTEDLLNCRSVQVMIGVTLDYFNSFE